MSKYFPNEIGLVAPEVPVLRSGTSIQQGIPLQNPSFQQLSTPTTAPPTSYAQNQLQYKAFTETQHHTNNNVSPIQPSSQFYF